MAVEAFYGLAANSSALLADAGHNASDVLSLVFAWVAAWLASIRPKGKYTYGLRRTTILVSILNAFPKNIDLEEVRKYLLSVEGVEDIHDLHIWAMSTTQVALTAHLIMPDGFDDKFISDLHNQLLHKFKIGHTTFQVENRAIEDKCLMDC